MSANIAEGEPSIYLADLADGALVGRIEAWILEHSLSTPFHRPAWIKAVATGNRQRAEILVAGDGAGGIRGVLPLNIIHSPLFGRALVSSGFAVDGGILADDAAVAEALGARAIGLAASWSCPTVELRGGATPGGEWITRMDSYLGFSRPLAPDDEAEMAAIPRKHRAELRKGLGNDLVVEFGSGDRLRDHHYALYCRSVHNLGTPVFPRAMFEEVLDAFGEAADIVLVSSAAGEPLSSVLSLYHGDAIMPYWQGADRAARQARSNEVAYFSLMGHARTRGCTVFDFGRSKVGTGPAAWKKTWGFEGVPLAYHYHAAPGHAMRDINPLSPQYRRKIEMWQRLPNQIVDTIGPWIARGLG